MELTKKLLEDRITNVREQGANAANVVQQAIGAELMLQELIRELELREAIVDAEKQEQAGNMDGLSE